MDWHSIFNFEIKIFIFFEHLASPRNGSQIVHLAEHLHLCTSNRPLANERYLCWPIACIYFMKNLIMSACRTFTFEIMNLSEQKTWHVNGPSAIPKLNAMHAFSKVLDQRAVALVVQTRCADVKPLWESEREMTRTAESLTLFSNDWFNLICFVDLFTHLT